MWDLYLFLLVVIIFQLQKKVKSGFSDGFKWAGEWEPFPQIPETARDVLEVGDKDTFQ